MAPISATSFLLKSIGQIFARLQDLPAMKATYLFLLGAEGVPLCRGLLGPTVVYGPSSSLPLGV